MLKPVLPALRPRTPDTLIDEIRVAINRLPPEEALAWIERQRPPLVTHATLQKVYGVLDAVRESDKCQHVSEKFGMSVPAETIRRVVTPTH